MMLSFLLESAARSLALAIVVWIALRIFRVRSVQNRSLAWTAVLLASATMPLLMAVMSAALASAPTVAWIPAVVRTAEPFPAPVTPDYRRRPVSRSLAS